MAQSSVQAREQRRAAASPPPSRADPVVPTGDDLQDIQGNIFGGFMKDYQEFMFLKFASKATAKSFLEGIYPKVKASSSAEVLKFNAQFKALKASHIAPESVIAARWTNIAFTHAGLAKLDGASGLDSFPAAFKEGMIARKAKIGDADTSDPARWDAPFKNGDIDAIVLLAADHEGDVLAMFDDARALLSADTELLGSVSGRVRQDQPGHEHFGFKDGVSQPGIRSLDLPDDPVGNAFQGHPGQDLLWPGEFVLGYSTQIPQKDAGHDGPNPNAGPISPAKSTAPDWARNGSYLVFRKLAQDVRGFRKHVAELARAHHKTTDLMGAKLVGRYASGCPLETRSFGEGLEAPSVDPGIANPALADSDFLNNNFEFGDDEDGAICPRAAHIRKAYPRDEITTDGVEVLKDEDSESNTQTHRLLRRGIPYGESLGSGTDGEPTDPRGLCFLAYQADIERQFEFVQSSWVNATEFPNEPRDKDKLVVPAGQDPIIAQSASGPFELRPGSKRKEITVNHFVQTRGGGYFFQPSIKKLKEFAGVVD